MKNRFKLLIIVLAISGSFLACRGSVNSGDAGTTHHDSIKTGRDVNVDTVGRNTNIVTDTSYKPSATVHKKKAP
jgi:hypothetical protein